MKRILLSILSAAAFSASSFAQGPAVPVLVNYQAYLTDNASVPYGNTTPTNYDVKFQLYTAATGGTAVWAELQTVTISAGQLSVLLGNGTQIGAISHANLDVIFGPNSPVTAGASLYLGITVNTVGANTASEFVPRQQIISNPLSLRAKVADTAQTVAAGGITSAAFANNSVTASAIADGSILAAELADNSVTSAKIAADTIVAGDIATGAVTAAEILDGSVTSAEIAADTIVAANIAANAVTASELAADAVTSAKIAADTIGAADIASNAVGSAELTTDLASLGKITNSRLEFTSATGPLILNTGGNPNGNWDIRIIDPESGKTGGIRMTELGFLDMTNEAGTGGSFGGSGFARLNNTGEWTQSSDRRLKRDIAPLPGLLGKALALQPVTYHFKSEDAAAELHIGFIAQDVQEVAPSLVTSGDTLSLNYAGMSTIAIGAIKEQHAIVEGQGERIESLEKENADLKARLERLEKALGSIK